jgi:hypothetical protein
MSCSAASSSGQFRGSSKTRSVVWMDQVAVACPKTGIPATPNSLGTKFAHADTGDLSSSECLRVERQGLAIVVEVWVLWPSPSPTASTYSVDDCEAFACEAE